MSGWSKVERESLEGGKVVLGQWPEQKASYAGCNSDTCTEVCKDYSWS